MAVSLDALIADPGQLLVQPEDQWFERKGIGIAPRDVAKALVAFANSEGGLLAVGASTSEGLGGVNANPERANELRQAALNLTVPPVRQTVHAVPCVNERGDADHLLLFEVEPSEQVHALTDDSVWLRVGDETRRLDHEHATQLRYDRGMSQFDGEVAPDATVGDLDGDAIERYQTRLESTLDAVDLLTARGLFRTQGTRTGTTWAGILLFGRTPIQWYPNGYVRLIKYEGSRAETGARMNVVLDEYLEGTIPAIIEQVRARVPTLLRSLTRLGSNGRFEQVPEYPENVWLEAVINAVTHRSYSYQGDHIRILLFDDRMEVESPGRLPGLVRLDNIRTARYSRNPRIARVLAELGYVRELGEGVDRMFGGMAEAGLPAPEFQQEATSVRVTLYNSSSEQQFRRIVDSLPAQLLPLAEAFRSNDRLTTAETVRLLGVSRPTAVRYLAHLGERGLIERVGVGPTDPTAYWRLRPEFGSSPADKLSVL